MKKGDSIFVIGLVVGILQGIVWWIWDQLKYLEVKRAAGQVRCNARN